MSFFSTIGISGIPVKFSLAIAAKLLKKLIRGEFEVLNFGPVKGHQQTKTIFIGLTDAQHPRTVINDIQKCRQLQLHGFIPNVIPKHIRPKMKVLTKKVVAKPGKVIVGSHRELMRELQNKYTGLLALSKKTGHQLLEIIAVTIADRLKVLMLGNNEGNYSSYKMTSLYRKMHPHFCDFQLVLSTLHDTQDAAGIQRTHLLESDLIIPNYLPLDCDNIPYKTLLRCNKEISEKVVLEVSEHLKSLKTDMEEESLTEEEKARKKVREELKKMAPFLPAILKQVNSTHLSVEPKNNLLRLRIYGEPFLPIRDKLLKEFKKYKYYKVQKSTKMYNMMNMSINQRDYDNLIRDMDQNEFAGAKLVIRLSESVLYDVPFPIVQDMMMAFGDEATMEDLIHNDDDDDKEADE